MVYQCYGVLCLVLRMCHSFILCTFLNVLIRWHRRLPIEDQQCFCDFALVAGDKYEEDQKLDFIRDLLKLKHFPLNLSSAIDEGVYKSFCAGLQKFVIVNKLKSDICGLLVEVSWSM